MTFDPQAIVRAQAETLRVGDSAATHAFVSFALLSVDRRDHLAPNIR